MSVATTTVPINAPATKPATTQIAFSRRRSMVFNSAIPSIIMLLPRETMSAIKPHESAPATAEERATRQAMLEKGTRTVKSQV